MPPGKTGGASKSGTISFRADKQTMAERRQLASDGNLGFPLSLADASVDPFAQQVSVAAVAGVLLDHVDKHFAQRDGVSVSHNPADAEVG